MKKIAFFDLLAKKGYVTAEHKQRLLQLMTSYKSGSLSYAELTNQGIQLVADIVAGTSVTEILALKEEFVGNQDKFFSFVPDLLSLLNAADFQIYLVSGGASPAIQMLAETLGITDYFASEFEIAADSYTGTVIQILNHDAKQTLVEDILNSHAGDILSLGFGDSTGDVEMLSAVDKAFVINPHQPEMTDLITANNWQLVTEDTIIKQVQSVLPKL